MLRTHAHTRRWALLALGLLGLSCRAPAPPDIPFAPAARAPVAGHPRPEDLLPGLFVKQHYGVLIAGKKVGHQTQVTLVDPASGEYVYREDSVVQFENAGQPSILLEHEVRRYGAAAPHALVLAESTSAEDGVVTTRRLKHGADGWTLDTVDNGQAATLPIPEVHEELEQNFVQTRAAIDGEAPFECRVETFQLESGRMRSTRLRSKGPGLAATTSRALVVRRVESLTEGEDAAAELEYDATGQLLRWRVPGLVELVAMEEAAASAPNSGFDPLVDLAIRVTGVQARPEGATQMRLEWRGVDTLLPEREFQHARWLKEGEAQELVLDVARVPSRDELAASVPVELQPELAADPSCEVDDPRIRALATKIAPSSNDAWERTRRIVRWVDRELVTSYNSNHSTALGVLEARAGDCTEHTLLACALLRAAGIPSRRVAGVILMDSDPPTFGQHAWIEVWIGRWIPVDPTWSQAPADATHVYYGDEDAVRFLAAPGMSANVTSVEPK